MEYPLTCNDLIDSFQQFGMRPGQTVLVHSALSKVGQYIVGGAEDVIEALMRVLGADGTLMMPTHTNENTNPAFWQHPPVPEHWWDIIRQNRPPYNPKTSKTREMGVIPELFRTYPNVQRSDHPVGSFAAWGKHAAYLTVDHHYSCDMFGDKSPIGKLYELDGFVLMLGSGHANNTSLHLAEYRATYPNKRMIREGSAVIENGVRCWVEYDFLAIDTDDFEAIGAAYEESVGYQPKNIGKADVRFMRQRPMIDFAVDYMEKNRA